MVILNIKVEAEVFFNVIYDFNGEEMRLVVGGEDGINPNPNPNGLTHSSSHIGLASEEENPSTSTGQRCEASIELLPDVDPAPASIKGA